MAGILEGNADRERLPHGGSRRLGQELGDIDDARGAVILQVRAAPGRVRDDHVVALQRVLEVVGARDALFEASRMRVQRAAAALRARDVHVEAVGGEDACGGRR